MPMRAVPEQEDGRIYRKIGYGPLLDVFMVDMRSYRDSTFNKRDDRSDTCIFGAAQLAWLKRELVASDATWKVIAADMPIGLVSEDAIALGDGPPAARARDRRSAVVHEARRHPQHGVADRRHALHGGAPLRSEPRGVSGFRTVLGVRLRPVACGHLGAGSARQYVRAESDVPEGLQRRKPCALLRGAIFGPRQYRRPDRRDVRDLEGLRPEPPSAAP